MEWKRPFDFEIHEFYSRVRGFFYSFSRSYFMDSARYYGDRISRFTLSRPYPFALLLVFLIGWILFLHCLPSPLFSAPTCTVILDRHGRLLAATIAEDGQYRFAPSDSVPERFAQCITHFEDRYFYLHPGVNPVAIAQAAVDNYRAGRVVRGGSTLTMQVARMLHPRAPRTVASKLQEMLWALRLESLYSKRKILALYASYAPFGGNVVGLDAAAWRYFGTQASNLSWGQMAALAVLPNAPGAIFPGAASRKFRAKRDGLLRRLAADGVIDSLTLQLSLAEPLPQPAEQLPQHALQLVSHLIRDGWQGRVVRTSLDYDLQVEAERVVEEQGRLLAENHTYNVGALVADVPTGQVLAYVGNVPGLHQNFQGYVNTIIAPRSSGSILKPFLYAGMLEDGLLLPQQLVPDVPVKYGAFAPKNYDHLYYGAVPASQALARSLNIPSVHMLKEYTPQIFLRLLARVGFTTFTRGVGTYGLSLILGGGECTLWDATGAYASMARVLGGYTDSGAYPRHGFHPLTYLYQDGEDGLRGATGSNTMPTDTSLPLGAGSIYLTMQALRQVNRPEEEAGWRYFSSSRAVAWKTGTSYGARDAWSVGVNRRYAVGVWVGNATGRGQQGLSGVGSAAPIMFHLWGILPPARWFATPYEDLTPVLVCRKSGFLAGRFCPDTDTIYAPNREVDYSPCPYHQLLHLDSTERFQVTADCYPIASIHPRPWFVLPPAMSWFYALANGNYAPPPEWLSGCEPEGTTATMQFIYPRQNGALVSVPRDLDGQPTGVVFQAAHAQPEAVLFWHLDGDYVGQSVHIHQLRLRPAEGRHLLTIVDRGGASRSIEFTVVYSARGK